MLIIRPENFFFSLILYHRIKETIKETIVYVNVAMFQALELTYVIMSDVYSGEITCSGINDSYQKLWMKRK